MKQKAMRSIGTTAGTPAAYMAKLEANAVQASTLLKTMANPTRLMVLCQIAHGERSVGELEQAVGLSQSGLSQHLAVLRARHLVTTRRVGQTILYSLASREAASVMSTLYEIFCGKVVRSSARDRATKAA